MNRPRRTARLGVLAALALALLLPSCAKNVEYKLDLSPGTERLVHYSTDQTVGLALFGQRFDTVQHMTFDYTVRVIEQGADGRAWARFTYERFRLSIEAPTGNIAFDSDAPAAQPLPGFGAYEALAGQSFDALLSANGAVHGVRGVDALLDRLSDAATVGDPAIDAAVREQMKEQFGEEALSEMMEQMLQPYPDHPVQVGDSWAQTSEVTAGYPMQVETTWTLLDREKGVSRVGIASTVSPLPDAEPAEMGMLTIRFAIGGTQTGTVRLDEKSGWVVDSELEQDLSGEVTLIDGPPAMPVGMEWPIELKGRISVTVEPRD